MATYEFRFVGEDETFATQQMEQKPVVGETVTVDGLSYEVESVDPTDSGQAAVVYVYDPEAV